MRKAKLIAWFFFFLGASTLLFNVWDLVTGAPPPPTKSLMRNAMVQALTAALGSSVGIFVYHLIWGSLGGFIAWISLRILGTK